jgi:hypothetical protein
MDARKTLRRGLPLMLLGAAATVLLRRSMVPRPALPPGPVPPLEPVVANLAQELRQVESQGASAGRFQRVRIDIVTVVDDLLGSARS